jgi:site-specific recombinase XerC
MDQDVKAFRAAAARENRGRTGLQRRYSVTRRAQAVRCWEVRQRAGEALRDVAVAFGVAPWSLHRVRLALQRAGIGPHPRHVAHLFRHSLATRMIRHGASLAEIAEVLRHRSQTTTALYAKVSLEALRSVARSWPVQGGAQ